MLILLFYKVLYAGDGVKNDAFPSKNYAKWDSLLVLENMLFDEKLATFKNDPPPLSDDTRKLMVNS